MTEQYRKVVEVKDKKYFFNAFISFISFIVFMIISLSFYLESPYEMLISGILIGILLAIGMHQSLLYFNSSNRKVYYIKILPKKRQGGS